MKKTLAALIIGAFAASAANAAVIYNNEGTKVELNGSLRINLEKSNQDGINKSGNLKRHTHSGLKNDGSRFEIKVRHDLGDGYYALARTEVRFDGDEKGLKKKDNDGFGNLTTKRAYVGLGHKEFGQVTFGRQVTIVDDVVTAEDKTYGLIEPDDYVSKAGKSVVRYDYYGIEGLQLGVGYQFAEQRKDNNEVLEGSVQNSNQFGALYEKDGIIAKTVFGRTNYKTGNTETKEHRDGVVASLGYEFNGVTLSVDSGYAKTKFKDTDKKETRFFVSPGFQYQITDLSKVYGNYKYEQVKNTDSSKDKQHGFLLGIDYKLHKQVVTYLEGKYQVTKSYDKDGKYVDDSKVKDKAIGVGIRVYF
ncbi:MULTISPECIES: porin [Haemophilus]|uniref:porin n=1 Tax=Haemophilus TaxID=724 RepID=UPI000665B6CD|nr:MULTISPECIES: porin [Haemophilus]UJZ89759.1 porin [Haemophilus seminalis]